MSKNKWFSLLFLVPLFLQAQEMSDWEIVYEVEGAVINKVDFYDDQYAVAVGNNGLVLVTEDGGVNWDDYSDGSLGDLVCLDVVSKDLTFVGSETKIYKSADPTKGWDKVFEDATVKINNVQKSRLMPHSRVNVSCDDATVYSSRTNGDKWYTIDLSKTVDENDDMLYFIGGIVDGFNDTIYHMASRKKGFIISRDNLKSVEIDDYMGDDDLKLMYHQYDFNDKHFYDEDIFIGANNEIWLDAGQSPIKKSGTKKISGGLMIRYLFGDQWFGYAVGEGGYISEAIAKTFGTYTEITSPTDKDLNWIDWGADPDNKGNQKVATICAVGDGVILQKRWGWGPVSSPRISYDIQTEVYPNPFSSYFKIESRGWDANEEVRACLYDINGMLIKELYQGMLPQGELQLEVIEELPKGLYFMELSSDSKREVKRLIKN